MRLGHFLMALRRPRCAACYRRMRTAAKRCVRSVSVHVEGSGLELPERTRESDIVAETLGCFDCPAVERRIEPVAVPGLREPPHRGELDRFTIGGLIFLRPKECDVASCEDDVVPLSTGGKRERDVPLGPFELAAHDSVSL